jgi:hypothetical protein
VVELRPRVDRWRVSRRLRSTPWESVFVSASRISPHRRGSGTGARAEITVDVAWFSLARGRQHVEYGIQARASVMAKRSRLACWRRLVGKRNQCRPSSDRGLEIRHQA